MITISKRSSVEPACGRSAAVTHAFQRQFTNLHPAILEQRHSHWTKDRRYMEHTWSSRWTWKAGEFRRDKAFNGHALVDSSHQTNVAMRASANNTTPMRLWNVPTRRAKDKAEASRHSPLLNHRYRNICTTSTKLAVDIACQARFDLPQCSVCWNG